MQEPKVGTICVVCFDEEASKSLMRCSTCKNRFYCSAKCQKNDWKEHKWSCSVLPVNGLPAATVIELDDEFKGALRRVVAILKEVADGDKSALSVAMLAPLLQIPDALPSDLQYTRAIEDSDKFKYRLPIITASRLLLIDYVAGLDTARRQKYEEFLTSMQLPTNSAEMYGPKIIGRPADLSPGEYATLAQTMPMWAMAETGMIKPRGTAEEESVEMRWIWLAVVLRRTYSATDKSQPNAADRVSSVDRINSVDRVSSVDRVNSAESVSGAVAPSFIDKLHSIHFAFYVIVLACLVYFFTFRF